MRFWDASALVPLLLEESASAACRSVLAEDRTLVVWWGTELECASAISRLERSRMLDAVRVDQAVQRLAILRQRWLEIQPVGSVRSTALRLLRLHPVRSADALQLAAAIVCAEAEPGLVPFVCLDRRLADAARREGFTVIAPHDASAAT